MKWFHHYASERKSEELLQLLSDPEFGHKGYALYFMIKEIITEKVETYNKTDSVSMTIAQWCAELYTKWKVLEKFLNRYSKNLSLEYEIKSNPAPLASKSKSSYILRIKSLKALSELESRMSKNKENRKYSKDRKDFKDVKDLENNKSFNKYSNIEVITD